MACGSSQLCSPESFLDVNLVLFRTRSSMQYPQMSPPRYPHYRPRGDLLLSSGSESSLFLCIRVPRSGILKGHTFLSHSSPYPASYPLSGSPTLHLVWLSLLNLEFLLLGQTPSKIDITLPSPVKPLKFYLLQEA